MKNNLKNKTAWLTGGKRIGQEVAVALAALGANLVVSYRSLEKEAQEIVAKVKPYGIKILILQADVTKRESVAKVVAQIKKTFGQLDLLIELASIFKPVKLGEVSEEDWDLNFAAHVKGSFWPIQAVLAIMPAGAHIITVSDRTVLGSIYPGYLPYVVTKSAVAALTRALAVELGPKGIFINTLAPGPVLKPDDLSAKEWQAIRATSIIQFPLTDEEAVEEFVATILRLCFVRSSGGIYPLDFGQL